MGEETKELRRLVIKAYHVREVQWGSENEVTENGILTVDKESSGTLMSCCIPLFTGCAAIRATMREA